MAQQTYKELVESAKGLLADSSLGPYRSGKLKGLVGMASDPTGTSKAGRPAGGSADLARKLKGVLKPEYPSLKEEVQRDHPVFQLDAQTQALMTQAGKISSDLMTGALPDDVTKQVSMIAAEKALKGGLGISQSSRNLQARDLGLTSLDLKTKGAEMATNLGQLGMDLETKKAAWLSDMRKMDLDAATMRTQTMAMDREFALAKFKALGDAIGDYHNKVYQFRMTRGDAQGNIDDASEDYLGFIANMRKGLNKYA